jgi:DNA ligase-1
MDAAETEIGVFYLCGELPQGRIGVGYAQVSELGRDAAASEPSLTLQDVDQVFAQVASLSGKGSARERSRTMDALMLRATPKEQDFLRRLLLGELRQGALEGMMSDAVARGAGVGAGEVRRAVMLSGNLGAVARALASGGPSVLGQFHLELFRPVEPMLAQTAENVEEALAKLGRAAFEFKFDGARIQVHRSGGDVAVFTRNLNDVTVRVPEIVELVKALPASKVLLDGEAIALKPGGAPEPFQITMRRFGRRLADQDIRRQIPLHAFFFDCLHLDGEDLIDRSTEHRLAALRSVIPEVNTVPYSTARDAAAADRFFRSALEVGHEGLVAKSLDASYEAGRRGASWLKIKRAHTLELVVLAAEWGSGRRKGWLSNLHLGARDPATNSFVMLGKTFKGLTDEMLSWQTQRLLALEIGRDAYTVHVKPELVVEVAFDGLQSSPHYPGGIALRFARVRRYRPDKNAQQADTIETVRRFSR